MLRRPMAKKWKNWSISDKVKSHLDEDDEEIDVVTIHQNGTDNKCVLTSVVQYQPPLIRHPDSPPVEFPSQSYYKAAAEDYPTVIHHSQTTTTATTSAASSALKTTSTSSSSQPQQQVRLTSVIHHSGSLTASPMQPQTWAPSSPTEGTTAPSPPPHVQHSSNSENPNNQYQHNGYQSASEVNGYFDGGRPPTRNRSLAMCFTSTGAALSLPPKKKDIYRPYSLEDRPATMRWRPPEDLHAAHAILDLSASTPATNPPTSQLQALPPPPPPPVVQTPTPSPKVLLAQTKTVSYTYEAFFVSDGRSKKKVAAPDADRPKYTCSECGKQYATSSNLSRHKQTHRSLDSQSAKKCVTCGKAYVSMPALAMHLLTHKLNHACGICGKLFSRPWLLQGHLRSHTGEKPYGCAHCGKAFADRSNLRAHMQTHSGDKNFQCLRCRKTFALKSYLNKHLESACTNDDCFSPVNVTTNGNQVTTITIL